MLYRTTSTSPMLSLRQEIDQLFEDTFRTTGGRAWTPAVDVRENDREFSFEFELPGLSPDRVDVTTDSGVLTVRGEKAARAPRENDEGRAHVVERSYGSFVRAFQLPQGVDEDGISADFENGVLTVHVPKSARPQPRRINIGGSAAGQVSGGRQTQRVGTGDTNDTGSSSQQATTDGGRQDTDQGQQQSAGGRGTASRPTA